MYETSMVTDGAPASRIAGTGAYVPEKILTNFDLEKVVLDTFVREFILLDLPMSPTVSDLPSEDKAAIPPAPSAEGSEPSAPLDPRLAPLAAIAERLREHKK